MAKKITLFLLFIFLLTQNSLMAQSINTDLLEAIKLIDKMQYLDSKTSNDYEVDILCPQNIRVNTDESEKIASNISLGYVSCSDKYIITSISNDAPKTYEVGNTVVTWRLKVKNGKELICNQTVRVKDIEAPIVLCPINVRVKLDQEQTTATNVSLGNIDYSDNCGIASITNNAPKYFSLGNTIVTWTVTDINKNSSICNQAIRVKNEINTLKVAEK